MTTIRELHLQAMDLAEKAFYARRVGKVDQANTFFREALRLEEEAANSLESTDSSEPTRSILLRSAASIAKEYGEYREAEKLIALGLAGNPPEEIARELRDLLEKVNFYHHMEVHGVVLEQNEFQVSFTGNDIMGEYALSDVVFGRLQSVQNLIYRTTERLSLRPYRDAGISSAAKRFPLFVTMPRPNSFAITLRLGRSKQLALPGLDDASPIINEIMNCVNLINQSDDQVLSDHISDAAYFNNFVGLIQKIAPDGESVKGVGFTAIIDGDERKIPLLREQVSITQISKKTIGSHNAEFMEQVTGQLRYANSIKENEIKLVDEFGKIHKIVVPEGMMSDIVKPLWYEIVTVTGKLQGKKIILNNIQKAD